MKVLKRKLRNIGIITAADEQRIKDVFQDIKDGKLKNKDKGAFKQMLSYHGVKDQDFIRYLIKNPDVDVLDWLDPRKSVDRRNLAGGTGTEVVRENIENGKEELGI